MGNMSRRNNPTKEQSKTTNGSSTQRKKFSPRSVIQLALKQRFVLVQWYWTKPVSLTSHFLNSPSICVFVLTFFSILMYWLCTRSHFSMMIYNVLKLNPSGVYWLIVLYTRFLILVVISSEPEHENYISIYAPLKIEKKVMI